MLPNENDTWKHINNYRFDEWPSTTDPFGFESKGEAPMPSEDMVKEHIAMPNKVMPSDHVSVVCDFEWVKKMS